MTLTEYFAQEKPVRVPHVVLVEGEYIITNFVKAFNEERARVYIEHPQVAGVEYCAIKPTTNLWTTDGHGNPKARSCFHLPIGYKTDKEKAEELEEGTAAVLHCERCGAFFEEECVCNEMNED